MTVSTELSHEEYTGNGVTTDFDFRFRIFEAKHLVVSVADPDGTERILTNGTDYTLRGVGSYRGGKVILKMPLATGWKIGIARDLPAVQETDLRNQGKFFAEVHEDAFDYLTMLIQKSLGYLSLCLRKPSFISDHYDAKGNKISNLGKPVKDGDAVDLGTMKEHISAKDKRSLRVADKDIPALPGTSVRRNKQLGFDNNGMPLLLDPAETGALGYVLVDSFEKGALITSRYQALHWLHNGEYYRWDGVLPKTVPENSAPDSSGGIGVGAWIGVGDASSRRWVEQHYSPSFYVRTNASFIKGGEVNSVRDCILNTTDGFYYKYTGAESFPVSVPAGSSPDGDWTCVYSAIDNLETVCFSDAIVAGEMHPLKITTTGYHVGSDIGGNEFVPSGTGTPGDTDHGSFFVTSKGVKYHSTSPVAWATQFGATKDGGSEDIISAAISRMPQWSSFGIDPGIKFNKPITASVVGMTFTGRGIHSELTTFDKGAAFIITSEYITFEKMNIRGTIEITDDNAFILDAREYKRADFDVFMKNCRVGGFRYAVSTKGRGVEISECLFYEMETVLKISVPDITDFEDGPTAGQKYPNAFRTYYITDNRLHSVYGFVAENLGDNAHVAKGFLITGNISDGLCGGLNGYFKNLDWYGNNFGAIYQGTSIRPALFELWSPDCVNISGSFTGYPAGTDASGNPVEQRIYQGIARIHDAKSVKFDVSVAQYAYHGFSVDGASLSVDINVNGDSPLGNGRSVVKLEDNASVKNLKISGLINNINAQEKVYLSAGSNVTIESMDLSGFMVSNRVANESISDIPPAKYQNIGSQGVSYTGNGAASMNVVLDASPKSVTIFGGSKGIFKAHYQIPALTSNVTFNRRTIAVKGDCNASGQVYYVEYN